MATKNRLSTIFSGNKGTLAPNGTPGADSAYGGSQPSSSNRTSPSQSQRSANTVPLDHSSSVNGVDVGNRNLSLNKQTGEVTDDDTGDIVTTVTTTTTTTTVTKRKGGRDGRETEVHVVTGSGERGADSTAPASNSHAPMVEAPDGAPRNRVQQQQPLGVEPQYHQHEQQPRRSPAPPPIPQNSNRKSREYADYPHPPISPITPSAAQQPNFSRPAGVTSRPSRNNIRETNGYQEYDLPPQLPPLQHQRQQQEQQPYQPYQSQQPQQQPQQQQPQQQPQQQQPYRPSSAPYHQTSQPSQQTQQSTVPAPQHTEGGRGGGTFSNLKDAAVALHGVGEVLRSSLNEGVDSHLQFSKKSAAQAAEKNRAELEKGQREMARLREARGLKPTVAGQGQQKETSHPVTDAAHGYGHEEKERLNGVRPEAVSTHPAFRREQEQQQQQQQPQQQGQKQGLAPPGTYHLGSGAVGNGISSSSNGNGNGNGNGNTGAAPRYGVGGVGAGPRYGGAGDGVQRPIQPDVSKTQFLSSISSPQEPEKERRGLGKLFKRKPVEG
ncbi:hypothetical protein BAUCODRAFT_39882 [Baudoinia panamericana UAMH 10762]|uniref:Uncharacterized protein n=1 Tax=Baudoinia panamericana (strain UAMH 10762) TaxID=717646 RepID=M2MX96_BAUPA|nr:uncharacterized protein BAUCODRAFT_39882 [Baudoinia panamericana UAMH 10762]EMC90875.1 hypothetical protein BAUCODRAFT_39882 [Baudoinia panamericana UAMH 10762]